MSSPAWRRDLRALIDRDPEIGEETKIINDAIHTTESSRGSALIAGSVAEGALEQILKVRLVPMSKERMDDLFGVDGLLNTFSAKIKIAYAVGVIDDNIINDLDKIREIRNVFAHSRLVIEFTTPAIRRACMGFVNAFMGLLEDYIGGDPRQRYVNTAYTLLQIANIEMRHYNLGHTRKLRQIISYDEAVASRDNFLRQSLQRQAGKA